MLLVVGGIAVFFHLEHWERIFNGFGHITSGITQELIAIVVLAVVAVIYLVYLRKNEGAAPKWIAIVGIVVSVVLLLVMAHSYMMPARPAWDSVFQIISIVGAACVMGPATMAFLCSAVAKLGEANPFENTLVVAGSAINVLTSVIYVAVMSIAGNSYASMGSYFDPTHPTYPMVDTTALNDVLVSTPVPETLAFQRRHDGYDCGYRGSHRGSGLRLRRQEEGRLVGVGRYCRAVRTCLGPGPAHPVLPDGWLGVHLLLRCFPFDRRRLALAPAGPSGERGAVSFPFIPQLCTLSPFFPVGPCFSPPCAGPI